MTMDSASITVIPTHATLDFAHSLSVTAARSMTIDCYLEPGTDVRLPTDRSLKNVKWSVYVTEAVAYNDHAREQGAIGFLKYWPESQSANDHSPETCHASFALKQELFCTLLSALQDGRLPKAIHIEMEGLQWGWEPGGRGVVWNVEAAKALPILEVRFNVPLLAEFQHVAPDNPPAASDQHPSTTHDVKSLERSLVSVLQRLETRITRVGIAAIVLGILLLLFSH
jgi:hypothetical protein